MSTAGPNTDTATSASTSASSDQRIAGVADHEDVVASTRASEKSLEDSPQSVAVNTYRTDGAFVIVAPVPGVRPDDVHIELRESSLRFWTHVRSEPTRDYDLHEWHYGGYERMLEVPDGFGASVVASLGNGQLAISVAAGEFTGDVDIVASPAG
ncbi:MAG: Hsp20/alpha crystallin family protein [Microthrixaceae bacterium]|nr:Hsp20/alpha crystallin family protein [Microthrixaceae bacterium]